MSKFDKNQIVNWKFKRLYRQIRRPPPPTSYEKKGKSPFSRFLVLGSFIRAIRGWADPTTDNIRAHIYQYQNIYHLSSLSNIYFFYLSIHLSIHLYIYLSIKLSFHLSGMSFQRCLSEPRPNLSVSNVYIYLDIYLSVLIPPVRYIYHKTRTVCTYFYICLCFTFSLSFSLSLSHCLFSLFCLFIYLYISIYLIVYYLY